MLRAKPEGVLEHRQVVECVARNPCKQCKRNQNPGGVTEFCRAFGTYFLVADFSRGSFSATLRKRLLRRRASLRFTTCLYSCQAFGLLPAGCSLLFGQTTSPSSPVANEGFAPLCGAAATPVAALKTPVASEGGWQKGLPLHVAKATKPSAEKLK